MRLSACKTMMATATVALLLPVAQPFTTAPAFLKQSQKRQIRQLPTDNEGNAYVNNRHSASDWFYNIQSFPQSGVLREVRNPVIACASSALAVSIVQRIMSTSSVGIFQSIAKNMCIPATAHGFLVSALGLLLVFRTNSAYQRFYEGRKIWEDILSISRNLSRMVQLYGAEIGHERKRRIMNLVAAYPYLLRHHIRPGCLCESDDEEDIDARYRLELRQPSYAPIETRHEGDHECGGVKSAPSSLRQRRCWVDRRNLPWSLLDRTRSLKKVAKTHNRPLWICDRLGREIMSIPYGPNFTSRERLSLLGQIEKLSNAVGQCERIHQTAVPLNYARHSLRSLTMWLFTLPFALVKDLGLLTAPATACIAWLLFGVYQIGYSIEDPFQGSLRLSILCDAIRRDVIGVIGNTTDCQDNRDSAYQTDHAELEHTTSIPSGVFGSRSVESFPSTAPSPSMASGSRLFGSPEFLNALKAKERSVVRLSSLVD